MANDPDRRTTREKNLLKSQRIMFVVSKERRTAGAAGGFDVVGTIVLAVMELNVVGVELSMALEI